MSSTARAPPRSSARPASPGTFGTTETDKGVRIVWHYRAQSELRSFRIHYRLRGVAVAYDDVVDVNVRVWGDEWEVGLRPALGDRRRSRRRAASLGSSGRGPRRRHARRPAREPARGRDSSGPVRRAPRSLPPPGVHVDRGDAGRIRTGPRADRRRGARRRRGVRARPRKIDDALDHLPRTIALLLALALGPALLVLGLVWLIYGREHGTSYDREYEQEPPTETAARARPVAARPGRHARLARVHGDAVRPDPPRPLPRRAGDDGAEDLGRPQDPAGLRSRALARRRRSAGRGVRGAGRPGRRRDPRRGPGAPLALPRPDRGRPDRELGALQRLQVGGRRGDLGPEVVQQRRPRGSARRCGWSSAVPAR